MTSSVLNTGSHVVVSTSYEIDIEHDRLTKTRWVSMDRLMARADVSVHHAGWGSTVAALATGTPSVTVPLGADQFGNSQAMKNTGAGVSVQRDRVSEDMAAAGQTVLDGEIYRLNAERVRTEIDAMPSAEDCIPLVEELAEKGVVFNKP